MLSKLILVILFYMIIRLIYLNIKYDTIAFGGFVMLACFYVAYFEKDIFFKKIMSMRELSFDERQRMCKIFDEHFLNFFALYNSIERDKYDLALNYRKSKKRAKRIKGVNKLTFKESIEELQKTILNYLRSKSYGIRYSY